MTALNLTLSVYGALRFEACTARSFGSLVLMCDCVTSSSDSLSAPSMQSCIDGIYRLAYTTTCSVADASVPGSWQHSKREQRTRCSVPSVRVRGYDNARRSH
jgi:hypothetical protein